MKKVNCVMLIDDNPSDNFYNKIIIEEAEAAKHIVTLESALEALDYLKLRGDYKNSIRPNLIFLDINMPKMNGFEFLIEYNKLPNELKADILILMLTTSTNPRDVEKAKEFGIYNFYTKPLNKETLQEIIETGIN